jgi:putative IMPACT (imprinted ancient) family translation regulator
VEFVHYSLRVGYADISAMQQLWPQFEVQVVEERYEADVQYAIRLPRERVDALRTAVQNATRGQSDIVSIDEQGS